MPSPVGTRHRRLAAAAAPVGLYSGFSASRDSAAANCSNKREMAFLDVPIRGWLARMTLNDARSATAM